MLGVGGQYVEENILARFDRLDERSDLLSGESPLDIKADLLLDSEVVNCTLLKIVHVG